MAIEGIGGSGLTPRENPTSVSGGEGFAKALTDWMKEVNTDQVNAAKKMEDLVVHGKGSIHEAMIAINDAQGSFRLLMEMRNRIVDTVNRLLEAQG